MQKIIVKSLPAYSRENTVSTMIYLAVLSALTYVCYLFMPPLFVLQALLSWVLIYNSALLVWGIPPAIGNIYFLGDGNKSYFYPYLDGSHNKFFVVTELFVCFAAIYLYATALRNEIYLNAISLFTLLLSVHFGRKLIFLLRAIHSYGKQTLANFLLRHYVQQGQYYDNRNMTISFFGNSMLLICASVSLYHYQHTFLYSIAGITFVDLFYIALLGSYGMQAIENCTKIILMIGCAILTAFLLYCAGFLLSYNLILFCLFLTILFIYLILLWAKDTLLRDSHILYDESTCDALKHDVKNHVQTLVESADYAILLTSALYAMFIIFLFSVILRLNFAPQIFDIITQTSH